MQIELTRELLERYLRATGWRQTGDVWARHGLEFTWISTKHVNHIVANVRQAEGTHTTDEEADHGGGTNEDPRFCDVCEAPIPDGDTADLLTLDGPDKWICRKCSPLVRGEDGFALAKTLRVYHAVADRGELRTWLDEVWGQSAPPTPENHGQPSPTGDGVRLCFYCDYPAGICEDDGEDQGPLEPHTDKGVTEYFHADCWAAMLKNPGCSDDEPTAPTGDLDAWRKISENARSDFRDSAEINDPTSNATSSERHDATDGVASRVPALCNALDAAIKVIEAERAKTPRKGHNTRAISRWARRRR